MLVYLGNDWLQCWTCLAIGLDNSLYHRVLKKSLYRMRYWKVSDWIVIIPIAQSNGWLEQRLAEEIDNLPFCPSSNTLPTLIKIRFCAWRDTIYPSLWPCGDPCYPFLLAFLWSLGLLAGSPSSVWGRKRKGRPVRNRARETERLQPDLLWLQQDQQVLCLLQ